MEQEISPNSGSVISSQVEITGTVRSAGSIRIDGKLNGDLSCNGDATIGDGGAIKGNLDVNSVTIAGVLNGNVVAKDRIEMKSSAQVMGDIKAKRLVVEDGVTFIGKTEVNPSGAEPAVAEPDSTVLQEVEVEERVPPKRGAFAKR